MISSELRVGMAFAKTHDEIVVCERFCGRRWRETRASERENEVQEVKEAGVGAWVVVSFVEWWLRGDAWTAEGWLPVCHLWDMFR